MQTIASPEYQLPRYRDHCTRSGASLGLGEGVASMVVAGKAPTIHDIARRAGVSSATVSRVLSKPDKVALQTREHVFEAIKETGYIINETARSLRRRSVQTIVAALPHIGDPFYSTILESVVGAAASRGYAVLVAAQLEGAPNRWLSNYLDSNRADGLLVFDGSLNTQLLHRLAPDSANLPLVAAYDELPDQQVNSILTDNRAAAGRAVQHLINLGHRDIGHITGQTRNAAPNERLVGFCAAMEAAGLPARPEWIMAGDYTMPAGVAAADAFVALRERPSAMFVANDEMAIGFISRLRDHGLSCPQDVSVIGFDDIAIAALYFPPLTTMRQPREEIGRIAVDVVIDIIEGLRQLPAPLHVVLDSPLIARASTAPYRVGQAT